MADLQKIVDDLSKLTVIEADELTSADAANFPGHQIGKASEATLQTPPNISR